MFVLPATLDRSAKLELEKRSAATAQFQVPERSGFVVSGERDSVLRDAGRIPN
jgi:hypothetical protein